MRSFSPFLVKIKIALGVGLVLLGLVSIASFWAIDQLIEVAKARSKTEESLVLLERTASSVKSVESALRQYLLSGTAVDLKSIAAASDAVRANFGLLRSARLLPEQAQLDGTMLARRTLSEQAIAARQTLGTQAAVEVINNALSIELRRRTEVIFQNARQRESAAWQSLQVAAQSSANWAKRFIAATGLLFVSLLAWVFYVVNHYEAARRRIEAELLDKEAMSRSITEGMAQGVITTRQDNTILDANAAALALYGYEKNDLVGRDAAELVPLRFRDIYQETTRKIQLEGHDILLPNRDMRSLRKDGSEFTANMSFSNVKVGEQQLYTALIHDITESRRMTKALRTSEAQLRQITDAVPALIAYVDSQQCFSFHNQAYETTLGLDFEEIRHRSMAEVLGPLVYASVKGWVEAALSGQEVHYEREHVTPDGDRKYFAMQYFPRYAENTEKAQGTADPKVIGFFSLGTDITEIKRIDQMKTEFISTVSHELRTPLTSIRGSLGLIAGGVAGELPEKISNLVGIAKSNCERLIRLINDMLDSEKIESGKMRFDLQAVDIRKLVEQSIASLAGFAGQHQIAVRLMLEKLPPEPANRLLAYVDPDRLTQVLTNLLSNSIKFSPPGGTVGVAIRLVSDDSLSPSYPSSPLSAVRVEVTDQGKGIDNEFKNRIFQKFSQADSSDTRLKGGTGLGLNISRALIEKMNGRIGFDSQLGQGSTFYFEVPQAAQPKILIYSRTDLSTVAGEIPTNTGVLSQTTADAQGYSGAKKSRILHVEDDPDIRLIAAAIGESVADFECAATLGDAVRQLQAQRFDLVLLDLALGEETGWSLFDTIDTLQPRPPVVVFSASEAEPDQGRQAHALLVKAQTSNAELLHTIERVLKDTLESPAPPKPR